MKLKPYNELLKVHIENYYLKDLSFTSTPKEVIKNIQETSFPILCMQNEKLVCFFVLDNGEDKFKYTDNKNSLLLRSFSTDSLEVKKGYASSALRQLPYYVKNNFPTIKNICLGVNEKNTIAIHLYGSVGFKNTGKLIIGLKGTQKVLKLEI